MEEKKSFSTGRKPLKGAVLFTVLSVMMVILILMITTVGLSSVASKRAYSEYYDAQIAATGRSVINTVLESLEPTSGNNKALGKTIYTEVSTNGSYEVHLGNGGNLGQGLGRVDKIEFSKAGVDDVGDFFVNGSSYMIMKVTATITMGNKTTTYTEYVSDMVHSPGKNGGNGGLLSTNGADSSGTGMTILGPFGGGFKDINKKSGELQLSNPGAYVGTQFFNQSIWVNTYKTFLYDTNSPTASYSIDDLQKADYQGVTVLGDVRITNNSAPFVSKTAASDNQSTPYIFLTGKFDASGATHIGIGSLTTNSQALNAIKGLEGANAATAMQDFIKSTSGNKVNLYCGSFEFPSNKINIASDIYCYDSSATSVLGGDMNITPLITWADDQVTKGTIVDGNVILGNIYTKGNLKLSKTKVAVKGNVYVDGSLDLSSLDKKDENQIPDIIDGKFYCKSVLPSDYNDTTDAGNKYKNLLTKIEIVSDNKFPADMELDKILGITFNAGVGASGADQLQAVNEGKYSLSGTIDFTKKIVQNPLEMKNKFYEVKDPTQPDKWTLRNSYSQSGVTHTAKVYTNSGLEPGTEAIPSVITEQCVIKGSITNKKITITPKPKTDNQELWITLDGVSLNSTEIIVQDKVKDASNNDVEAGPVCFYIKDGTDLSFNTGSRLITKFYADNYYDTMSNNNRLKNPINIKNSSITSEYIPNIYVYGSNREDLITSDDQREDISFSNYSIITAYIIAPRATLSAYNMSDVGASVTYEGVEYKVDSKNIRVGIIGSAIVGPIKEVQNDIALLYVDNSNNTTPVPPHDYFGYHPLQGFTNY